MSVAVSSSQIATHARTRPKRGPLAWQTKPCQTKPTPIQPPQHIPTKVWEVTPATVTPAWLAGKVPELRAQGGGGKDAAPAPLAAAVVEALIKADILKPDGHLKVWGACWSVVGDWACRVSPLQSVQHHQQAATARLCTHPPSKPPPLNPSLKPRPSTTHRLPNNQLTHTPPTHAHTHPVRPAPQRMAHGGQGGTQRRRVAAHRRG